MFGFANAKFKNSIKKYVVRFVMLCVLVFGLLSPTAEGSADL
jgi:hypothetical protein